MVIFCQKLYNKSIEAVNRHIKHPKKGTNHYGNDIKMVWLQI